MTAAWDKLAAWRAGAIPLAATALLLSACGSSSTTRSATAPAARSASSVPSTHASATLHRDPVTRRVDVHRPMNGTGGHERNDANPGRADSGSGEATGQNPCTLVSKAEAQAIIGRPIVTAVEAPLGPTCIYQPRGSVSSITVAVESIDFAKIRPQIRGQTRGTVDGRTAYCGDYGRPTTFVLLAGKRVLNVAAPCAIGTRLAAKALPRLQT